MKLYTKKVDSCIGMQGYRDCPHGRWADVNCTRYYCQRHSRNVDFENKPEGMDSDKYIPK